jgi:hypothetical protein
VVVEVIPPTGLILSTQASPLNPYPVSHHHHAYRLAGAVDHSVICVANSGPLYHQEKIECSLVGESSLVITHSFTIIIASVHHLGYTFIAGDVR